MRCGAVVRPEGQAHELTPAERAAFAHLARLVLHGYAAHAARAGASTSVAHAAHDGHTAAAVHAALTGDQDRDYFSQVQGDLAAGKFADALGLLDSHWPTSAHDRTEARAYVGGVIVARLHATLAPLTMDRMLHALEPLLPPRGHRYLRRGHHGRPAPAGPAAGRGPRPRPRPPHLRPDSP